MNFEHYPFEVVADEKTLRIITKEVVKICRDRRPNYIKVKEKIQKPNYLNVLLMATETRKITYVDYIFHYEKFPKEIEEPTKFDF